MDTALVVASISGGVAIISVIANVWSSRKNAVHASDNMKAIEKLKTENEQAKEERQRQVETTRFREPLARAAYDLQSRIYNIVVQGLVGAYLKNGNARTKKYVVDYTSFLISQYFCWSELIRREIQFVDLGDHEATLQLSRLQDTVAKLWRTSSYKPLLMIFAGEQRALGESLIQIGTRGPECMGYGAFNKHFPAGADELMDAVRADVASLARDKSATPRLIAIQNALIDLLEMLDPDHIRFSQETTSRIPKEKRPSTAGTGQC